MSLMQKTHRRMQTERYTMNDLQGTYFDSRVGVQKLDRTSKNMHACFVCGGRTFSKNKVCKSCQEKRRLTIAF